MASICYLKAEIDVQSNALFETTIVIKHESYEKNSCLVQDRFITQAQGVQDRFAPFTGVLVYRPFWQLYKDTR